MVKVKARAKVKKKKVATEGEMPRKLSKRIWLEGRFREGIIFTQFSIITVKQNKQAAGT